MFQRTTLDSKQHGKADFLFKCFVPPPSSWGCCHILCFLFYFKVILPSSCPSLCFPLRESTCVTSALALIVYSCVHLPQCLNSPCLHLSWLVHCFRLSLFVIPYLVFLFYYAFFVKCQFQFLINLFCLILHLGPTSVSS